LQRLFLGFIDTYVIQLLLIICPRRALGDLNADRLYTAILYRASTGPVQGFPCVLFPHREKPVFIAGFPGDENRFLPVRNTTQGKLCFHHCLH
jgi:hypothetical protein